MTVAAGVHVRLRASAFTAKFPARLTGVAVPARSEAARDAAGQSLMLLAALALLSPACWPAAVRAPGPAVHPVRASPARRAALGTSGAGGVVDGATRRRLGGATAALDAAAVARAVYPGLTPATGHKRSWSWKRATGRRRWRPRRWRAHRWARRSSTQKAAQLPAASVAALEAMRPLGPPALGGAQVIAVGTSAPAGYRALILHGGTSTCCRRQRSPALVQRAARRPAPRR